MCNGMAQCTSLSTALIILNIVRRSSLAPQILLPRQTLSEAALDWLKVFLIMITGEKFRLHTLLSQRFHYLCVNLVVVLVHVRSEDKKFLMSNSKSASQVWEKRSQSKLRDLSIPQNYFNTLSNFNRC